MELHKNHGDTIFNLEVDETAKAHLLETARWSRFLAIVCFIIFSLLLLGFIAAALSYSSISGKLSNEMTPGFSLGAYIFYIVLMLGLEFYPVYALYKFSTLLKSGINTGSQEQFNRALGYQKGMFKYMGIITILALVMYGLVIVFVMIGVAMGMS